MQNLHNFEFPLQILRKHILNSNKKKITFFLVAEKLVDLNLYEYFVTKSNKITDGTNDP